MPRQHSARAGRRTQGSWTPRIAGLSAAVLVAGGGAIAYSVASPGAGHHPDPLPMRVQSVQTVGIIARPAPAGPARLLTDSPSGLAFGPIPAAEQDQGDPQWTADTMVGGTYIFIYAPDGMCLAAVRRRHRQVLALKRCDLGRDQRWQRVGGTSMSAGHEYGQYRDLGSDRCLTAGATGSTAADTAAGLTPCAPAAPASARARQLVSFWWAA
jgi:hypothetical protein